MTAGATTITTGYNYNPLDQVTALTRNGATQAQFVYDERGNIIGIKRGNGTYSAFEYDDGNRLKSVKNYNAAGDLLDSYTYAYDANGNRTSVTTTGGTITYEYDALNQLTKETLLDGTVITYEYDAVGNRTKKVVTQGGSSTTTTYTYDAGNQLTAVNGQTYTYDTNGNLTNNGSRTFVYDAENRLIQVKDSGGATIASFTYDHEGKRKSMTTASGTIFFHYAGDKVIYETDANNNVVASYTWDAMGNPVSMTKGVNTYYYHLNGHGDVVALTDASGAVVAQYTYDAWGNILSESGTMKDENPYRYAGYRFDEATGLYYLMARYYDSSIGRFISRDTFHGFEDEPNSLNQYVYTHNNPVKYIDPSGHWIQFAWSVLKVIGSGVWNAYSVFKNYYNAHGKSARRITSTEWAHIVGAFAAGAFTSGMGIQISAITKAFGWSWYKKFLAEVQWQIKSFFINNASKGVNPISAAKTMYNQIKGYIVRVQNYF